MKIREELCEKYNCKIPTSKQCSKCYFISNQESPKECCFCSSKRWITVKDYCKIKITDSKVLRLEEIAGNCASDKLMNGFDFCTSPYQYLKESKKEDGENYCTKAYEKRNEALSEFIIKLFDDLTEQERLEVKEILEG